jgi:hypothetical protein
MFALTFKDVKAPGPHVGIQTPTRDLDLIGWSPRACVRSHFRGFERACGFRRRAKAGFGDGGPMNSSPPPPLVALPLDPLSPRLPVGQPFTPAIAARAGIGRTVLDRLHREGRVRRLLRGVYVDATVPVSAAVRAQALRLVIGDRRIVVGTTAAWLHGVELPRPEPVSPPMIEVHGSAPVGRPDRRPTRYADRDLQVLEGVRCTTPLRTALDLGRQLPPDRAIAALDGLLALGAFRHTGLMAELSRFTGQPGIVQLRELAALADGRAQGPAESVLRLRWLDGRLPTPAPGLLVTAPGGRRVRLALGLEVHRFGVVLAGRQPDADLAGLASAGWRVAVLGAERVLRSDPAFLIAHLEREFHQHLLEQVG